MFISPILRTSTQLFWIVTCLFVNTIFAQTGNDSVSYQKHKIGLVLSGGGAKGFAHIGVLKAIEKAGVKLDYIGGTSMGAVVGGLYAAGYNASQIDSIFKTTDFDALLSDFIPRSSKNFYEKRNDELYALSLPFNKFKVGIPLALSKGLYNYNLLNRLTQKVRDIKDFSKLPIPFICIATDIETGEEVVLRKGYLAQAMLASSAFPTLFSPVEMDGKYLIDGGVTNNYPVDQVREMGADYIIGVDVQDELKNRKNLKDATKILVQISNLQMIEKMRTKIGKTDIYLKPDIENFGVISFNEGQDIIKKGEEAAMKVFDKLKNLADPNQFYKRPDLHKTSDSIFIKNIEINELKNYTRAYIIGKLGFKPNSKISYKDLDRGIDMINATHNFSGIHYTIESVNKTENSLVFNLTENQSKTFLKFALHYDGLFKSAILTNLTHKKLFFKNDNASLDVILGDNFRYNFDYYIDNGYYWSFGIKSKFNKFSRNVTTDFSDGQLLNQLNINSINVDYSNFSNQVYVQTIFAQKFLLGFGAEFEHLKIRSQTLQNRSQVFENSDYFSTFGNIKFDSFDNKYFPKKGVLASGNFQTYLASSNYSNQFNPYSIAKIDLGFAQTVFKKFTFLIHQEAGSSIGVESVPFFDFVFGGYGFTPIENIKPFYGYDFLSFSGNSFIKTAGTLDYEIFKKSHLNFTANFANAGNHIFQTVDWIRAPKYSGYALGYGLETIIGPIEVKYSWSPEKNKGFVWFTVGFSF